MAEPWTKTGLLKHKQIWLWIKRCYWFLFLSGEPDYFGRNKISSGGDLSHYSSASLY